MSSSLEYEIRKYDKYKRDITHLVASFGVWPNFNTRCFRIFLSLFSAFCSVSSFYCIVLFCVNYVTNISTLTKGLGLLIGFLSSFMKVCILSRYQKDLVNLNEGISLKFEKDLQEPESRKHLLAHLPTFSRFFYIYTYFVGVSIFLLAITPLLMLRHGQYVRMLPVMLPFNYELGGMLHWYIYGFEVLCGFYLWTVTCGSDSIFGLYSLHMVGELKLLSDRFQSLRPSSNYKNDLKGCINKHILLIETRRLLERVFGFLSLWLAITCAVALCALVFQVTEIRNLSILRICYLISHFLLKLIQAYSYAWYGNVISVESEECLKSMYNAYWPGSGDTHFMSDVLIVLSQKPFVFHALDCMYLRLDMFSKIVHTSASYYFLLRTLEEKS